MNIDALQVHMLMDSFFLDALSLYIYNENHEIHNLL